MSSTTQSRDAAHFERIYANSEDPWNFRTSPYERAKYAATMAALQTRRFRAALEVGCSIGELTRLLTKRCDAVHGLDIAAAPLEIARLNCDDLPQVRFSQMAVPAHWPPGLYDLIMLSEVLYFLAPDDVQALAERVCQALPPNGVVVLVNWLGTRQPVTKRPSVSSPRPHRRCGWICSSALSNFGSIGWSIMQAIQSKASEEGPSQEPPPPGPYPQPNPVPVELPPPEPVPGDQPPPITAACALTQA